MIEFTEENVNTLVRNIRQAARYLEQSVLADASTKRPR